MGKSGGSFFVNLIFSHFIGIIVIFIQIAIMIINYKIGNYHPFFLGQLFFLPMANLVIVIHLMSVESAMLISFILMLILFSIGMWRGREQ